jgi:hypothetical protein
MRRLAYRKDRTRRRAGEVAVFDIVLFVPLLLVALLFLESAVSLPQSTVPQNVNSSRYASQGMNALLGSSVPSTRTWMWQPPIWPGPCWPNGCWFVFRAQDWSVRDLILWDVYLVSCGVTTQAQLSNNGWMGSAIGLAAQSVAQGYDPNAPGGSPTTFQSYYLQYNGTALGVTPGCTGPPTPMRAADGFNPPLSSTELYTWSTLLQPDPELPGQSIVQVQMGYWGP